MAAIIPFPRRAAPAEKPDQYLALVTQWARDETTLKKHAAAERARSLLGEAGHDPVEARLAAIEAKLDKIIARRERRAS